MVMEGTWDKKAGKWVEEAGTDFKNASPRNGASESVRGRGGNKKNRRGRGGRHGGRGGGTLEWSNVGVDASTSVGPAGGAAKNIFNPSFGGAVGSGSGNSFNPAPPALFSQAQHPRLFKHQRYSPSHRTSHLLKHHQGSRSRSISRPLQHQRCSRSHSSLS